MNFSFLCKKCQVNKKQSRCNLTWMPNQILVFSCLTCGVTEVVNCDNPKPKDKEDFDKRTVIKLKGKLIN